MTWLIVVLLVANLVSQWMFRVWQVKETLALAENQRLIYRAIK